MLLSYKLERLLAKVIVSIALVALCLGVAGLGLFAWGVYENVHQYDAEKATMYSLVQRDLPIGSRMAQAIAFFGTRDLYSFQHSHFFDDVIVDTNFDRVSSPDQSSYSASYPQGKKLVVLLRAADDTTMSVALFFDTKGRFTHSTVEEWDLHSCC